jgi:hypothetical protein
MVAVALHCMAYSYRNTFVTEALLLGNDQDNAMIHSTNNNNGRAGSLRFE